MLLYVSWDVRADLIFLCSNCVAVPFLDVVANFVDVLAFARLFYNVPMIFWVVSIVNLRCLKSFLDVAKGVQCVSMDNFLMAHGLILRCCDSLA